VSSVKEKSGEEIRIESGVLFRKKKGDLMGIMSFL